LNPKKTTIGFSKGKMVEHIVLKDGVAIDPEKFDKISKFPFPTTEKSFEVFWGWWVIIEGSYTCLWQKHVL
jgi:hypothetical protein